MNLDDIRLKSHTHTHTHTHDKIFTLLKVLPMKHNLILKHDISFQLNVSPLCTCWCTFRLLFIL